MPALKNTRHERFAQELAAGKSASEAYVVAGYRANTGNAATLKAQQSVQKRVAEIGSEQERINAEATERAIDELGLSRADIIRMVIEDRNLARECKQAAAAIAADKLIGMELHGLFVERKVIDATVDQTVTLSVEDKRARAMKMLDAVFAEPVSVTIDAESMH